MKTDKQWLLDVNIAYEKGKLKGRAEAIEKLKAELIDIIQGNDNFGDWQKEEIILCLECAIEELKEQNK